MRVMGLEADMTYRVSAGGLLMALGLYGAIYLLILLSALLRVRRSTAIQLMRSEAVGEKPPRANWAWRCWAFCCWGRPTTWLCPSGSL